MCWNQCSRLVLWQGAREVCLHTHHQRTFLIVGLVSRLNYCHSSRWELPARRWGLRYPCGYLPLPPWLSFRSPPPLSFLPYLTSRKQQVWPDSHSPICHSWIAVLVITLLGHIDCTLEPNQGLGPSPSRGLAWSSNLSSPARPLLLHPLANSRGLASLRPLADRSARLTFTFKQNAL